MNEMIPKLPQELQKTLEQYYTSPMPRPEFASRLEAQLRQNVERARNRQNVPERISFMKLVQTRPLAAALLALLALLILSGAAYAIGKVTGFVPGVGIVDQSAPLRILAEPVTLKRDGLTITISEVIADMDHTFVAYTLDGILVPATGRPTCGALPSLQLPDGSALNSISIDDGGPQGVRVGSILKLEQSITYSSIPAGVNQVTFVLDCILLEGTGPENWQIPLKLSPAPKAYATPAVEIDATFIASNPAFVTSPTPISNTASTTEPCDLAYPNGSGLYLDKVIELPDSYILVGNFTDAGDLPGALEVSGDPHDDLPEIKDAEGNPVPFKVREDIPPEVNECYWARYWAFEIMKPAQGPLTITLDQINIGVSSTAQFKFDAGSNPQTGQKWELNLPVHLGTYEYVMDSVEVVEDAYLFKYHSGVNAQEGSSLLFNILGTSPEHNASTVNARKTIIEYSESITFSSLPTGPLTVELTLHESVPLQGPWTLTWAPPKQ